MMRKVIGIACAIILVFGLLAGCKSFKATALVNTLIFNMGDFQKLQLDYDAEDIHVIKSDNDKIVLNEYMNEDIKSYYAKTTHKNGELIVTEGKRPKSSSFDSYIELLIPSDYKGSLSIHTTSGTITSEFPLNLSDSLSMDTTSGVIEVSNINAADVSITTTDGTVKGESLTSLTVRIVSTNGNLSFENIKADNIEVQTTNADTRINEASGLISYTSKGGNLTASNIKGAGSFNASGDGSVNVSFNEVTGDIYSYSKNGRLEIELPSQLAFKFSATTKGGAIDTSFADQLTVAAGTAAGMVGSSPDIAIVMETQNGNIKVSK